MTIEQRTRALIEAGRWSNSESRLRYAQEWIGAHKQEVRRIAPSQWEALLRAGERASTRREFYAPVKEFLKGARDRDKAQTGWGQRGLASSLVGGMLAASRPDPGPAESDLRLAVRRLTAQGQVQVRRTMRLRACRQFLAFILMTVKAERRRDGR